MRMMISMTAMKNDYNVDFKRYWIERYPQFPIWPEDPTKEFRPQRELYDSIETDLGWTEWLTVNQLSNYRSDMALKDYPLLVEFDGEGMSHLSAASVQKDRMKNNQNLRLGYIQLRYSVSELKSSFEFVADEIREVIRIWFEV